MLTQDVGQQRVEGEGTDTVVEGAVEGLQDGGAAGGVGVAFWGRGFDDAKAVPFVLG